MPKKITVSYNVSSYPSKFEGYQSKRGSRGTGDIDAKITLFVGEIWKHAGGVFDEFIDHINDILLIERICLERSFQKIRLPSRCKICAPKLIAYCMNEILTHYEMKERYDRKKAAIKN